MRTGQPKSTRFWCGPQRSEDTALSILVEPARGAVPKQRRAVAFGFCRTPNGHKDRIERDPIAQGEANDRHPQGRSARPRTGMKQRKVRGSERNGSRLLVQLEQGRDVLGVSRSAGWNLERSDTAIGRGMGQYYQIRIYSSQTRTNSCPKAVQ